MTNKEKRIFLKSTKEALDEAGVEFWLESGTLLGAIRDGDFIEGDRDIDISVKKEEEDKVADALAELEKKGYETGYSIIRRKEGSFGEGRHIFKDGFKIDVYYWWKIPEGYLAYTNQRRVSINAAKHYDTLDTIDFLGMKVKVPHNPEEYLKGVYGDDWRIPNKDWNEDMQENLEDIEKFDNYFY